MLPPRGGHASPFVPRIVHKWRKQVQSCTLVLNGRETKLFQRSKFGIQPEARPCSKRLKKKRVKLKSRRKKEIIFLRPLCPARAPIPASTSLHFPTFAGAALAEDAMQTVGRAVVRAAIILLGKMKKKKRGETKKGREEKKAKGKCCELFGRERQWGHDFFFTFFFSSSSRTLSS